MKRACLTAMCSEQYKPVLLYARLQTEACDWSMTEAYASLLSLIFSYRCVFTADQMVELVQTSG